MNRVAELKRAELYQKNPLLQAPKDYDALGWRIFELAITDVRPHLKNSKVFDTEFRTMKLSARDTVDLLTSEGKTQNNLYARLKETCERMVGSYIHILTDDGFQLFPVFEMIQFSSKTGLEVCFNVRMKPFLLELEDGDYTRLKFRNVRLLSSPNAMQLLEHLLQFAYHAKKKNPYYCDISYEDLRYIMRLDDGMYVDKKTGRAQKGAFVKYVIKKPIEEINKKLPYHINFEAIRDEHDRRRTKGWRFWVTILQDPIDVPLEEPSQPPRMEDSKEKDDVNLDSVDGATRKLVERMHDLTENEKITKKAALLLIKKYGYTRVKTNFEYKREACYQKNQSRPSAALVSAACRDDYAGQAAMDAEIDKREKEHEEEKARREREAHETMQNLSKMFGGASTDDVSGEGNGMTSIGEIMAHIGEERDGDDGMIRNFLAAELTVSDARKLVTKGVDALPSRQRKLWGESKYTVDQVKQWLIYHDMKKKS